MGYPFYLFDNHFRAIRNPLPATRNTQQHTTDAGHAFVRAQFADSEDNPLILLPPLMNPTQREHHLKRASDDSVSPSPRRAAPICNQALPGNTGSAPP